MTLFVAVVITPTGFYLGLWKLVGGEDAPAWVQAIGSIAAIVGAFLFGERQAAHARRLASEERHADLQQEMVRREIHAHDQAEAERVLKRTGAVAILKVCQQATIMCAIQIRTLKGIVPVAEGFHARQVRVAAQVSFMEKIDIDRIPTQMLVHYAALTGNLRAILFLLESQASSKFIDEVWVWASKNYERMRAAAIKDCDVPQADAPVAEWTKWSVEG